ncbi:hypothetical protein [Nonlabens xiamenensis]|uniref:hypothetical protein n=1 Tax=Nonlabens xiamenensis TaxID=2341043 RepID=UPI000F60DD8B|nr:hypothetical protein [Nonlabens xiamenensis]
MKQITCTFLIMISLHLYAQVGINTDDPRDGAVLDIVGDGTQGIVLPEVALTSLTSLSPVLGTGISGMLVYNTNAALPGGTGVYLWNGTAWSNVQSSGGTAAWELTGNTGTLPTHYIGTADATDLVLRTNGVERVRIEDTGSIDINYSGTENVLEVNGTSTAAGPALTIGQFSYTGTFVDDHIGVAGTSNPAAGWGVGVYGDGGFYGVYSDGDLGATGTKTFIIDHPADPENLYLRHFSMESNEVLNHYRGVVTLDASGNAVISMPEYYELINKSPSYQLTPVGAAMPNLHVSEEIQHGSFRISGGVPFKKVSWNVTAVRNDPYLQKNPEKRAVELDKKQHKIPTFKSHN